MLIMILYIEVAGCCDSFKQSCGGLLLHSTVVKFNLVMGPLTQHVPCFLFSFLSPDDCHRQ